MKLPRPDWRWVLAVAFVLPAGCREELGPEAWPTTRVTGKVHEGRRPIGGGWVEFQPVEGTVGTLRVAPLRPDGTFVADGVAVGVNLVSLAQAPIAGPYRYRFRSQQRPIRRKIPPGPSTTLDIDLIEEDAARPNAHP